MVASKPPAARARPSVSGASTSSRLLQCRQAFTDRSVVTECYTSAHTVQCRNIATVRRTRDRPARELRRRTLVRRHRRGHAPARRRAPARRSPGSPATGLDLGAMSAYARDGRRPRAARADLPRARRPAQGARPSTCRAAQGRVLRAVAPHRRDPARLAGRHRRRHRHALRLRQQGHARAAQRHRRPRRRRSSSSAAAARSSASTSTPRGPGVAVQINAFNFPVWGMLEKLAPAFLAGLPTIVKPASQTAYLTELVVRRIIESGLLPEGSLQLLCGSPRGPARRADRAGLGRVHRLRPHRRAAAQPHQRAPRRRQPRRRGRLAQLLDPRARTSRPTTPSSSCSSRASSPR